MKARPILFSAPMVRALLNDRKTKTRRIAKGEALSWLDEGFSKIFVASKSNALCPYGQPGELLWVRETFRMQSRFTDLCKIFYKAHENASHTEFHEFVKTELVGEYQPTEVWKPSIFMPRWASRITLEITGVRIEGLNDISNKDAMAEGLFKTPIGSGYSDVFTLKDELYSDIIEGQVKAYDDPVLAYRALWNEINGIGAWEQNPWVWVIEFKVHKQNVDEILQENAA